MEAELTPLESAVNVLEMIKTEFTLTDSMVESSRRLVKEAVRHIYYFIYLFIVLTNQGSVRTHCGIFSVWVEGRTSGEREHVSVHK